MRGRGSSRVGRAVRSERALRAAEREAAANARSASVLAAVFGFDDPAATERRDEGAAEEGDPR